MNKEDLINYKNKLQNEGYYKIDLESDNDNAIKYLKSDILNSIDTTGCVKYFIESLLKYTRYITSIGIDFDRIIVEIPKIFYINNKNENPSINDTLYDVANVSFYYNVVSSNEEELVKLEKISEDFYYKENIGTKEFNVKYSEFVKLVSSLGYEVSNKTYEEHFNDTTYKPFLSVDFKTKTL